MRNFDNTAFKMVEKYMSYFKIKDLFKIPMDVATAHRKYRRLFVGTSYQLNLKEGDAFLQSENTAE